MLILSTNKAIERFADMDSIYHKMQAYKRYQVEQCKQNADFNLIEEQFSHIPYKDKEDMVSDLVEVLAKHEWIEPLYDAIQENRAHENDEDE